MVCMTARALTLPELKTHDRISQYRIKYNGFQASIEENNVHVRFLHCAAHIINLVGVYAASILVEMASFF
jgi:hypothetical protein